MGWICRDLVESAFKYALTFSFYEYPQTDFLKRMNLAHQHFK